MSKRAKILIIPGLILIALALHFIPIYSRTGVLQRGNGDECIGYSKPVPDNYRLVTGNINEFRSDKRIFQPVPFGQSASCAEPVTLRLYLL